MSQPHYTRQFFAHEHLEEPLASISKKFHDVAEEMDERLPSGPEKSTMLRKLLEAKDCAVRAEIAKPEASIPASTIPAQPDNLPDDEEDEENKQNGDESKVAEQNKEAAAA